MFRTKDKHIILGVGTQRLWGIFCDVLGIADTVLNDPRFATNADRLANRKALSEIIEEKLSQKESSFWLEAFREAKIPSGPINSVAETLNHPQLVDRGFCVELEHRVAGLVKSLANPVQFSETANEYRLPPPSLGEHNQEILGSLGYSPQAIEDYRSEGII